MKMARLRKVEPKLAIQAAQAQFWEHGYKGLGTRQIEEETGLNRFMLQTAYGGKRSLFLQVLDAYLDYTETYFLPDARLDSFEELAMWFESKADPACISDSSCHGCLMINSGIEFHGQDQELNERMDRFLAMIRERFRTILEAAKSNSTSSVDFNVDDKAEILMGIVLSVAVVVRSAGSVTAAGHLAIAVAAMIREWG
jgi:TetR/AcrR family transcriptional repressor of nem operon